MAQLQLDLFNDPSFTIPVGITLNSADNPFDDNVLLGSDVLDQLAYWNIDQSNPSAPMFSAAASLTPIPEPGTATLISVPLLLCLLAGSWAHHNRAGITRASRSTCCIDGRRP